VLKNPAAWRFSLHSSYKERKGKQRRFMLIIGLVFLPFPLET